MMLVKTFSITGLDTATVAFNFKVKNIKYVSSRSPYHRCLRFFHF